MVPPPTPEMTWVIATRARPKGAPVQQKTHSVRPPAIHQESPDKARLYCGDLFIQRASCNTCSTWRKTKAKMCSLKNGSLCGCHCTPVFTFYTHLSSTSPSSVTHEQVIVLISSFADRKLRFQTHRYHAQHNTSAAPPV